MDFSNSNSLESEVWRYDDSSNNKKLTARQITTLVDQMIDDESDTKVETDVGENVEAVQKEQRQALLKLLDQIVVYATETNRMELEKCQDAAREVATALMRLREEGETLAPKEMHKFEELYGEFR